MAAGRLIVAGLAVTSALTGAVLGHAAWSLHAARTDAARAVGALEEGRLGAARSDFRAAASGFQRSERSLGLLDTVYGWLPVASSNVRLARTEASAGHAATSAAAELTSVLADVRSSQSVLDLRPLRAHESAVAGAAGALSQSMQALGAPRGRAILPPLARSHRALLALGVPLLRSVLAVRAAAALAAPGRTYLLLIQNPAELRATGGLIGVWGLLTTGKKTLRLLRLAPDTALPHPRFPVPAPSEYLARYGRFGSNEAWVNANMSPDFPTSARVLLGLYRAATGRTLAGVIALDAVSLRGLLAATGPIRVTGQELTEESFLPAVLVHAYEESRRTRAETLLAAARDGWHRIEAGAPRVGVMRALASAAGSGHLRVFARDPDLQASIEAADLSGRVANPPGDYLLLVRQNAGGNKLDYYAHTEVRQSVVLDRDGNAYSRLTIGLRNDAPKQGLTSYAIGVRGPGQPPGLNRSYLSLYASRAAEMLSFRAGAARTAESSRELGHRVFSWFRSVPAESTRKATLTLWSPQVVYARGALRTYRLLLQSQPVLNPSSITVEVALPEGARVRGVIGPNARAAAGRVRFDTQLDHDRILAVTYCFCP